MAHKSSQNSWYNDPKHKISPKCAEELEELEKFHNADLEPIKASEEFKKNLKEKLWKVLKNKYYIVFVFTALFFS